MAISQDDNELLTRTGAGTPMGDLFRRYWVPRCSPTNCPIPIVRRYGSS